ncbi:ubiquitin-conjugating enzyme 34, partial [Prunus dulcis]
DLIRRRVGAETAGGATDLTNNAFEKIVKLEIAEYDVVLLLSAAIVFVNTYMELVITFETKEVQNYIIRYNFCEMAEKACVKRLQKEYRALCKEPVSHIVARPSPNDILEWHYVLEGSEGTPFAGGFYYGKIKFPPEYPYKPPGISMTTPNGRFMTQKKICLSMSDFHPESWNPMWSVSSILTGLLSFMMDNSPTTGSVNTTTAEKQRLAKASLAFNSKNPTFRKIFPEYVEKYNQQQLSEQLITERVSSELSQENSRPLLEKVDDSTGGMKRLDALKEARKNKKQSFPTWMMLLLISVFGVVMALPLLQL